MWCHVDIVLTYVSEEHIASIFRVEDKKKSASEPVNPEDGSDTFPRNVG
jgi:hypothetical protein